MRFEIESTIYSLETNTKPEYLPNNKLETWWRKQF